MIRKKIQFVFLLITAFILFSTVTTAQQTKKEQEKPKKDNIETRVDKIEQKDDKTNARLDSLELDALKSNLRDEANQRVLEEKIINIDEKRKEQFNYILWFLGIAISLILVGLALLRKSVKDELIDILKPQLEKYFKEEIDKTIEKLINEKSMAIDDRIHNIDKLVVEKNIEFGDRIQNINKTFEDKISEVDNRIKEIDYLIEKMGDEFEKRIREVDKLVKEKSETFNGRIKNIDMIVDERTAEFDGRIRQLEDKYLKVIEDKFTDFVNKIDFSKQLGKSEKDELYDFEILLEKSTKGKASAATWIFRGIKNMENNYYKDAIECFDKAIEFNPRSHAAFFNRGLCFSKIGEYKKAKNDYEFALDIEPDNIRTLLNIAEVSIFAKDYDDAISYTDYILNLSKKSEYQIISFYLKLIIAILYKRDHTKFEIYLFDLLGEVNKLQWSFVEIETWLSTADITPVQKQYIQSLTEKIKAKMKK